MRFHQIISSSQCSAFGPGRYVLCSLLLTLVGCSSSGNESTGDDNEPVQTETTEQTQSQTTIPTLISGPGPGPIEIPEPLPSCPTVRIVNVSQNGLVAQSCAASGDQEAIADCIEREIRASLSTECLTAFDVFVPGTASEDGAWKQFNAMFSENTGRGYLSLQYGENTPVDAAAYDAGVIAATESLDSLLYTLQTRFNNDGEAPDVRVFGHSKGSHAVSLVSDKNEFSNIDFYAFAQPGRTAVDIDGRTDITAAKLGQAGYIHKLSSNLVGITWLNDEVKFYTGDGTNGLPVPERWSYPGYIWEDSFDGGNPLVIRIDHHNNYGGTYTDGKPSNDRRAGEGSSDDAYPYCATGTSFFNLTNECKNTDVYFRPYFWGDNDCREAAFDMMADGAIGSKKEIGYSGPRAANCQEDVTPIDATYDLEYRTAISDLNDGDCRLDVEILIGGLGSRPDGGAIKISTSMSGDSGWLKENNKPITVAPHMTLRVTANLTDTSNAFRDCGGLAGLSSTEVYIRSLKLNFTHPGTGRPTTRTIIGLGEGSTSFPLPVRLELQDHVAWWEQNPDGDQFHLFYALPPFQSLMIKGITNGGVRGQFNKWVHLLD